MSSMSASGSSIEKSSKQNSLNPPLNGLAVPDCKIRRTYGNDIRRAVFVDLFGHESGGCSSGDGLQVEKLTYSRDILK